MRQLKRREPSGAQLPQRVAHPVQLGWAAVLGRPYAVFTVATSTGALLLALSVLPVADPTLRNGAIVVLIGLAGAATGTVLQLRQVLASPAVAEDAASLTAEPAECAEQKHRCNGSEAEGQGLVVGGEAVEGRHDHDHRHADGDDRG